MGKPLTFNSRGGGGDFKSVPAGSYIAVCNLVADLGIQPGSGKFPDPKRQVYIRFEIPDERIQYERDGKQFDGPQVIGSTYTASMHEKANLRKQLEGWRGRKFTDEEASVFDVSSIVGKGCMLSVVETPKGDRVYSNIAAIGSLPKGIKAPKAENELLFYSADEPGFFSKLPEWLREKIQKQIKPAVVEEEHPYERGNELDDGTYITDEDIPF